MNRDLEVARVSGRLQRLHSPRFQMMLIVALTATVGFLASVGLLRAGIGALWIRYPLAVALAYVVFLFLLWCWLRLRNHDLIDAPIEPFVPADLSSAVGGSEHAPSSLLHGGDFGGAGASRSFTNAAVAAEYADPGPEAADTAGALEFDELAVILLLLAAMVGVVWSAVWIVWAAPVFLGELLLDAALAGGLYRRIRGVHGHHWLQTAVRRTVWRFAVVALLLSLVGAAMQIYAPEARSIGQVFSR